MRRLALVLALISANWSLVVHCLATARAAEASACCGEDASPKPAKAPMSDCAVMVCCQAALMPAAVAAPAPESLVPVLAAVAALVLVPPASPAEFSPAASPGPPGVFLAASHLVRAPPVA